MGEKQGEVTTFKVKNSKKQKIATSKVIAEQTQGSTRKVNDLRHIEKGVVHFNKKRTRLQSGRGAK
jgi:hypothetical protein